MDYNLYKKYSIFIACTRGPNVQNIKTAFVYMTRLSVDVQNLLH